MDGLAQETCRQVKMLRKVFSVVLVVVVCLLTATGQAQERKIVVGPRNAELAQGADALLSGDAEEGVELTEVGLRHAVGNKEFLIGTSNLCAGYILQQRYVEALEECNRALAENEHYWRARTNRALIYALQGRYPEAIEDLEIVEGIAPQARTVRGVRALLEDLMNPVEPLITIDDRRETEDEE